MLTFASPLEVYGAEPTFWIFAIIMPIGYIVYMKRYWQQLTYIHKITISVLGAAAYTIMCVTQFVPHTSILWLVLAFLCIVGASATHKHAMQQ